MEISEMPLRASLEGTGGRWSLPSNDSVRSLADEAQTDTPTNLSRPAASSAQHTEIETQPDPAQQQQAQQQQPRQQPGTSSNNNAMGDLSMSTFKREDRRATRTARRSEAIDRAFAEAMQGPSSDFLPRALEERSSLFRGGSERRSTSQNHRSTR